MRTHFEAWCLAWKQIGLAHALGLYANSVAIRRAQLDALIYGSGFVRIADGCAERIHPFDVVIDEGVVDRDRRLRYANLQVTAPYVFVDGPGLVESLK
jgi:hypothetical protein